jgi:hypothetical protein
MGIFGDNLPRIAASPLFFLSNLHVKESQMTITSTEMNFKLIALLLSFALIFPTVWTNNSYAQFLQPGTGNDQQPPPSASSPPDKGVMPNTGLPSTIRAVNIISPTKGQQVPIGEDLTIIGTSISNATSNCKIIIGLNNIKPYQSATGTGLGGANDYSKWSFTLTPKYAAIKQGPDNKVTARYKCSSGNNNPSILLINSVNVTGVTTTTANQLQQQRQQQSPTIVNNATTNPQGTGIPWLP